ncbi:Gfo/Idh/MocA family oxidoreductase [Deinococcus rubellus]|uniref:Gfo/Idh/MocA family oxidoreductase n=1 Tax=Deinococcus rubellus TaxID=1889240 RepID=A0ABY5YL15_9DEIO|nr:Gfo/Idh/MocA family oxidoreductase [Deinococcus rubellus]UWX65621.1 Gfo/Idh/MocA family oxidoreductase [Deinococcus rubellus]
MIRVAIIGGGNRGGDVYARHLTEQGARVTHLVEARAPRLSEVAARHHVPPERQFADWPGFFALGRVADAVVIATPDDQHVQPCLAALALGYNVLLEKPVCLAEAELDALLIAERASAGRVTVGHVLRTTPFFRTVADVLESGRLGQLVGITLAENVAWWHYAHSYVRGNWRASPPAAPFILAKSVHDLDVLRWLAGAAPTQVESRGSLHHFRPESRPPGAAERCLDCPVPCPYDARRIYSSRPQGEWPVTVLTAGGLSLEDALRSGPYGECVYLGKNNVADHQTVNVTFENGVTAQLTSSAFTHNNTRTLKLLGSHGELRGQMDTGEIELHDFLSGKMETLQVETGGNHGGGDAGLVAGWLASLRGEAGVPVALAESLDSHRMAFWAERSRLGD